MPRDREERIRQRAYEIWEREGRPQGRDAEHWERATAEIDGEREAVDARASAGAAEEEAPETPRPRRRRAAPKGDPGAKRR